MLVSYGMSFGGGEIVRGKWGICTVRGSERISLDIFLEPGCVHLLTKKGNDGTTYLGLIQLFGGSDNDKPFYMEANGRLEIGMSQKIKNRLDVEAADQSLREAGIDPAAVKELEQLYEGYVFGEQCASLGAAFDRKDLDAVAKAAKTIEEKIGLSEIISKKWREATMRGDAKKLMLSSASYDRIQETCTMLRINLGSYISANAPQRKKPF